MGSGPKAGRGPDHTELSRPQEDLQFILSIIRSVQGF